MNYTGHILTWATFLPTVGAALIVALLGLKFFTGFSKKLMDDASRWIALITSAGSFAYAIVAWRWYDAAAAGMTVAGKATGLQLSALDVGWGVAAAIAFGFAVGGNNPFSRK